MKTSKLDEISCIYVQAILSNDINIRHAAKDSKLRFKVIGIGYDGRVLDLSHNRGTTRPILGDAVMTDSSGAKVLNAIIYLNKLDKSVAKLGIILHSMEGTVLRIPTGPISFSIYFEDRLGSRSDKIAFARGVSFADGDADVDWYCVGILTCRRDESGKIDKVFFKDVSSFPWSSGNVGSQLEELVVTLSDELQMLERGISGWYDLSSSRDKFAAPNSCELCSIKAVECESLMSTISQWDGLLKENGKQIKELTDLSNFLQEKVNLQKSTIESLTSSVRQREIAARLAEEVNFAPFDVSLNSENQDGGINDKMRQQENLIMSIKEQLLGLSSRIGQGRIPSMDP